MPRYKVDIWVPDFMIIEAADQAEAEETVEKQLQMDLKLYATELCPARPDDAPHDFAVVTSNHHPGREGGYYTMKYECSYCKEYYIVHEPAR